MTPSSDQKQEHIRTKQSMNQIIEMSTASEPPVRQHAEDVFQPLSPTGQPNSPSQRIQHISIPNGSSASFGYIVAKQWRADIANRRNTWAVVGTLLEAELLHKDIVTGAPAETPGITRESLVISDHVGDRIELSRSGDLIIMPFLHLREFLFRGLFADPSLPSCVDKLGGPTIVMDFNWGNTTFDMALSCSLIAKYINTSINDTSNPIMACTVSNNSTTYFGDVPQNTTMQRVMTPFDVRDVNLQFSDTHDDDSAERRGRMLLVMDAEDRQHLPDDLRTRSLDRTELTSIWEADHIALERGMSYVGCVGNLSDVLICPVTTGWRVAEELGQPVFCQYPHRVVRSQAEVHYRSRYIHETFLDPKYSVALTEERFYNTLPALCKTSSAHTVDLTALLICCKLLWPRTTIAEMPVYMPPDTQFLAEQLYVLVLRGIIETIPDDSATSAQSELSVLRTKTSLTTVGSFIGFSLVDSFASPCSAHLLAQLLDPNASDPALNPTSEAVVNTILSFIAIIEAYEGITHLNETIFLQHLRPGPEGWYKEELCGVGAGEAWRGPIWLALGIWQMLRSDPTLRDTEDFYDDTDAGDDYLALNDWNIIVHLPSTFGWDRAFESAVKAAKARGIDPPELSHTAQLTAEEMLAVEKALVRAFLDKLIYVSDVGYWSFEANNLLSGREIRRPTGSQMTQVWWLECQRREDPSAKLRMSRIIYCIYTHMSYEFDDSDDVWPTPADVTYVSRRAVQLVLEEVGMSELMPADV